jgi:hypothetical protein
MSLESFSRPFGIRMTENSIGCADAAGAALLRYGKQASSQVSLSGKSNSVSVPRRAAWSFAGMMKLAGYGTSPDVLRDSRDLTPLRRPRDSLSTMTWADRGGLPQGPAPGASARQRREGTRRRADDKSQ